MTEELPGHSDSNFLAQIGTVLKAAFLHSMPILPSLYLLSQQYKINCKRMAHDDNLHQKRQIFDLIRFKLDILARAELQQRQFLNQYELQKDTQEFQAYLSKQRMQFDRGMQAERLDHEEEREKRRLFVQWMMQKNEQTFLNNQAQKRFHHEIEVADKRFEHEVRQAKLSIAHQQALEIFRQQCNRGNLEWQFEQRRQLEWEFKRYDRETQILLSLRQQDNQEHGKILAVLKQKLCPNKSQTRFISSKHITIFLQPRHKTIRYGCTKCLQCLWKGI